MIELINDNNNLYKETTLLFNYLRKNKEKLCCSPTSFAITNFFLGKEIKNETLINEYALDFFSAFHFTKEDDLIMDKVKKSKFRDLEDALQYNSAEDSGMDIIITKNFFDFELSMIPVTIL